MTVRNAKKKPERLYLAYGSNLNIGQMKNRCPGAKLVGYSYIQDYRLIFRGSGSGFYLSIEPAPGYMVPCGVYSITPHDEASLDYYEGFPRFYRKKEITTYMNALNGESRIISAMVYYLPANSQAGMPTTRYVQTCKQGYADFGFEEDMLLKALTDTWEEIK